MKGVSMEPVVSLRDIFEKLESVSNDVGDVRSDTRVMREQLSTVTDRTIDHETRLRVTEHIATEVSNHPLRLAHVENVVSTIRDHPERMRSLEKKVWAIPGASTIIAIVALGVTIWKAINN